MQKRKWDIILVGMLLAIGAVTAGSIAMYAGYGWDLDSGSSIFEFEGDVTSRDTLTVPKHPPTAQLEPDGPGMDPFDVEPVTPDENGDITLDGKEIEIEDLENLAELEGLHDFPNATDRVGSRGWKNPSAWSYLTADMDAEGVADSSIVREIEEADLVKVVGDYLYILNPYRGLIIFDLSRPDYPVALGTASILGNPVDMYVVDDKAYVIVSSDYGYWYSFSRWGWWDVDMDMISYRYQIGSRLAIIDISDLKAPHVMREIGIEGFVTDSRRVGEVIYLVSNCYSWYNIYADTEMEDRTYVMSLNIADTENIKRMDETSFPGRSNIIHVTTDHLFVAQWDRNNGDLYGTTDITLVDISDPQGSIVVKATFYASGRVDDKYQMDEYDDVLRVVSHFRGRNQKSELWTFDVSNPWFVKQLGHLVIDDEGNLMATRFEGTRGYTIHLPQSIDPLDVLDISDPRNPVLCDVFEMPGWVTHMEVRGMKIIAIGVDDSGGDRNVAVSLFDVSDPWNVVMEKRVRLGGEHAHSNANWDPKALTVLDDQGIVLIPFYSYDRDEDGQWTSRYAVQVVAFDLEKSELTLGGSFEQPDQVSRTRSVNGRVIATSTRFMQVVTINNLHEPKVKRTIELCPDVQDHRVIDGYLIELIRDYETRELHYKAFKAGESDLSMPTCDIVLAKQWGGWYWIGDNLYVFGTKEVATDSWQATVTKVDISSPQRPMVWDYAFGIRGDASEYNYNEIPGNENYNNYYYDYYYDYGYYGYNSYNTNEAITNPVLIDDSRLVYYALGRLFTIDLDTDGRVALKHITMVDVDGYNGLMVGNDGVYVVGTEQIREESTEYSWYYYYHIDYNLTRVLIPGSSKPVVKSTVAIPGRPVGASSDSPHVYTTAYWFDDSANVSTYTLNVVRLGNGEAVTEHVVNIGGKTLEIVGDNAILMEYGAIQETTDSGYKYSDPYTIVRVLDLPNLDVIGNYVLMGTYSHIDSDDGYVILRPSDQSGVVVVDLWAGSDGPTFSQYEVRTSYTSTYRDANMIHMVQGVYGVTSLRLPT